MTPHTEDEPIDFDPARSQSTRTPTRQASGASTTTTPESEGAEPSLDADTPSPEVVPIYLRPVAEKPTPAVAPTTESVPAPSPPTPSLDADAETAATSTYSGVSNPDALADTISRVVADTLYQSIRAAVVAAIHAEEKEHGKQGPAASGGSGGASATTDAPVPPREKPAAEAPKANAPAAAPPAREEQAAAPRRTQEDPTRMRFMGRTPPFPNAHDEAWARHLAPRYDASHGQSESLP
jgi:hypothetical protein